MNRFAAACALAMFAFAAPAAHAQEQVVELFQSLYPSFFEPDPLVVRVGVPLRIMVTTKDREHVNRLSILPWIKSSDRLAPGRTTIIEFTPDRTGDFVIENLGHGFRGTLRVIE
jgi:heme/copper-type cytochrome/quinol oxidase subunit 2